MGRRTSLSLALHGDWYSNWLIRYLQIIPDNERRFNPSKPLIWLAAILFALALSFNVFYDLNIWLKEKRRNHNKGWLLKAGTSLPAVFLFASCSNFKWLVALIVSGVMCMFLFWLLFNVWYNIMRGFPPFYQGTNDKDDAKTDDFLQSFPTWLDATIQIALAVGAVYLYIIGLST